MPKRPRSGSQIRSTIKRRRFNYRLKRRGRFRRFVRRTVFNGLERHQNIYRGSDSIGTGGGFHWMVRAYGQGEVRTSFTTETTRDGYRIQPLSVRVDGQITIADTSNIARIIIFRTKTTYGGLPEILTTYGSGTGVGTFDVWSPLNRTYMGTKYKIYYDKRFMLNDDIPQRMFHWKAPKRALKQIKYSGDGMDNFENNMWVMVFLTDSAAVSHPTFNFVISSIFVNI